MQWDELLAHVELPEESWRVHFEVRRNGVWEHDFSPPGEGCPVSRETANQVADAMRRRLGASRYRNIRVVADTEPERLSPDAIVVPYCRVSKIDQDQECCVQRDGIEPWIRAKLMQPPFSAKWNGEFFIDPGISTKINLFSRPAGHQACLRLRKGDHFVIWKFDRAFRKLSDASQAIDAWHQRGIYVHVVGQGLDSTNLAGRMMMKQLAVFAEWEREMTRERNLEAVVSRRRAGKPVGVAPVGYKNVGKKGARRLVVDLEAMWVFSKAHAWRLEGFGMQAIEQTLLQSNIERGPGRPWLDKTLRRGIAQYERLLQENSPLLEKIAAYAIEREQRLTSGG